jgi:hypothetical protein
MRISSTEADNAQSLDKEAVGFSEIFFILWALSIILILIE